MESAAAPVASPSSRPLTLARSRSPAVVRAAVQVHGRQTRIEGRQIHLVQIHAPFPGWGGQDAGDIHLQIQPNGPGDGVVDAQTGRDRR